MLLNSYVNSKHRKAEMKTFGRSTGETRNKTHVYPCKCQHLYIYIHMSILVQAPTQSASCCKYAFPDFHPVEDPTQSAHRQARQEICPAQMQRLIQTRLLMYQMETRTTMVIYVHLIRIYKFGLSR
jgi:hypothetical protein